jgi:hypothetical protein
MAASQNTRLRIDEREQPVTREQGQDRATAPYFYGSILLRALKSEIIVLLTYVYKK